MNLVLEIRFGLRVPGLRHRVQSPSQIGEGLLWGH